MSDSHLARRGKQAAGLLVGVALFGGSLAALSSSASALIVKSPVDLATSTTATETSPINRATTLHLSSTISNASVEGSAPGTLTITVSGTTTGTVTPPSGLSCGAQVPVLNGFTVTCTTDSALAPGASKTVALALAPSADPHLSTIKVKSAAKLVNGVPATLVDLNAANNKTAVVVKVGDITDVTGVVSGPASVLDTSTYVGTGGMTNLGPNPVYGRFTVTVAHGHESSFSPPAGLTCTAMTPDVMGTGYSRSCTTDAPVASGGSLVVGFHATPVAGYPTMTVTVKALKVGGSAVDPNLLNNKVSTTATIVPETQNG